MTSRRPTLPREPAEAVRSLLPIAIVLAAAAVPLVRPFALVALVAGFAVSLRRNADVRWAWAAPIPVVVTLLWRTLPPPIADPGGTDCANPLSPPAVWRVAEAIVVLVVVTALAYALRSSWRELGLRIPGRRVFQLALVAFVVLGPVGLFAGPALAAPWFGPIALNLSDPALLLPAATFALANATLEEVAYRGALLRWAGRVAGLAPALAVQALAFGMAHGGRDFVASPLPVIAVMVAGGLVAGLIAFRTRSLVLPIAAHAALDLPMYAYLACSA